VTKFKYLETRVRNHNYFHEEIKSRLNLAHACYHLVLSVLFSRLLSKTVTIKMHKTVVILLFFMGLKLGDSH